MFSKQSFCILMLGGFVCLANAAPLLGFEEAEEDSAIVESVREVRQVKAKDNEGAPANYHRSYDSGNKGDVGYTRNKADQGKKGYQQFDSYHKKGGDAYGYEKHDSFGNKQKVQAEGGGGKASYSSLGEETKADHQVVPQETVAYEVNEDSDDYDGDYNDEEEAEESDDESQDDDGENVSESEAGIDESGYDEADAANYENPEAYTYGSGNEYDF